MLHLWEWHMEFFRCFFYQTDGRIFQLADAQAHAAAMSYTKIACGLIVFSFMTLTLTGLYTAQGDSKDTFYSESYFSIIAHKYGSGSCVDSWSGDVPSLVLSELQLRQ